MLINPTQAFADENRHNRTKKSRMKVTFLVTITCKYIKSSLLCAHVLKSNAHDWNAWELLNAHD